MLAVLPRVISPVSAQFPKVNYIEETPIITSPVRAPLAPRRAIEVEDEPEELPSIFSVPRKIETVAPKPKPKKAVVRVQPRPVKRTKKR
jgi:hypothetical protein